MTPHLPSRDDVCLLLTTSRASPDARVAPAISLILAYAATDRELLRARWSPDVDFHSYKMVLSDGRNARHVDLTELLVRQLMAIRQNASGPLIFGKPDGTAPSLRQLLRSVLDSAGLHHLSCPDFAEWSRQQSAATRRAIITVRPY